MSQPSLKVVINLNDPPSAKNITQTEEIVKKFLEKSDIAIEPNLQNYQGLVCLINLSGAILKKVNLPAYNSILIDNSDENKEIITFLFPASQYLFDAYRESLLFALTLIQDVMEGQLHTIHEKIEKALKLLSAKAPKDINTPRFIMAAHKLAIPWSHLSNHIYQYGWGINAKILDSTFTEKTPRNAAYFARNKYLSSSILRRAGIKVPPHYLVNSPKNLLNLASKIGLPVVVKPNDQDGGRGVSVDLKSTDEILSAFTKARKFSNFILIEKYIEATDYRFQILNGEVIWAVERQPGGVVGDGERTIQELLAELNSNPIRGRVGSNALLKEILLDDEAKALLEMQKLTPNDIPKLNSFVRLRKIANIAAGGKPIPILDKVHPDNLELVSRVARLMRLDLCGVDVLTRDISISWKHENLFICEVNAQPELSPHLQEEVMRKLIKKKGRVPITLVCTKSNQELITEIRKINKKGLGVHDKDGVWVGREKIFQGKAGLYEGGTALLSDPEVTSVISIVESMSFIDMGLAYDQIDNLVIMDNFELTSTNKELSYFNSLKKISNRIIFYNQIKKIPKCEGIEVIVLEIKDIVSIISGGK